MDDKVRKCCPNCSRLYLLKCQSSVLEGNLPLFLSCGHSICENCVWSLIKFQEPIECKICLYSIDTQKEDIRALSEDNIHVMFPVNHQLLGELTMKLMGKRTYNSTQKPFEECYIDTQAILRKACAKSYQYHCEIHMDRTIHNYCNDCKKSVCANCILVGNLCKDHNLTTAAEIIDTHIIQLKQIFPKVDATFRRLSRTAVDIGDLLYSINTKTDSKSEVTQMISNIEQHFSKLSALVEEHKRETISKLSKIKSAEKESLLKAKEDVNNALNESKHVIYMIIAIINSTNIEQMNLPALLGDAIKISEAPCFLVKEEAQNNRVKMTVNEKLSELISEFIHLEGNASTVYKLCSQDELGKDEEIPPPPLAPVFPPQQLLRSVIQLKKNTASTSKSKGDTEGPKTCVTHAPHCHIHSANSINLQSEGATSEIKTLKCQEQSQMFEGKLELVYVLHVADPHNFYVQRVIDHDIMMSLLREFRNAESLPKPSLSSIAEGKKYLALNLQDKDNRWYRCCVVKVEREGPKFHVFFVDIGRYATVSGKNLRLLPPNRQHKPLPLAIKCSLANCEPLKGYWTIDDAQLIEEATANQQAVIRVRRITPIYKPCRGSNVECDLFTGDEIVSLAHVLVFQKRAKLLDPSLEYLSVKNILKRPIILIGNADFKPLTVYNVLVTHVLSPNQFFVRKLCHQEYYHDLCDELRRAYQDFDTGKIYLPQTGMACVVYVEKPAECGVASSSKKREYEWARAVVINATDKDHVQVVLVDSGLRALVNWSSLRVIQRRFTEMRALAVKCHLAGIKPAKNEWSQQSVQLLRKHQNHVHELRVEYSHSKISSIGVTLFNTTGRGEIGCINKQMINLKYATSIGSLNFNRNIDPEDQTSKLVNIKKPKQKINKDLLIKIKEADSVPKEGPLKLEAKILQCVSPSIIYLSLVHQQAAYDEMFENIHTYYTSYKIGGKKKWKVGDKCCTICVLYLTWRRAVIVQLNDDKAKVFYTDFATWEVVPIALLKQLVPEFQSIRVAALKCHLSGIEPATGETWPATAKVFLKEILGACSKTHITKLGNIKDNSLPIELLGYHTLPGGALEPDKSEWRCLNKMIIEQGLAIPVQSEQIDNVEGNEQDEKTLSVGTVVGSLPDWLQLEPRSTKPEDQIGAEIEFSSITNDNKVPEEPERKYVKSPGEFEWEPSEPFKSEGFIAMVTFIDSDGVVYLHDIRHQRMLELIGNVLNVRYDNPDPNNKCATWTVGEPCIALFDVDQKFYRARVVEVHEKTSDCLLHYIDYGNDGTCSFKDMRKKITLHQIPIQAHKCILDRIKPIGERWDTRALQYIYSLIVDKECYVKITGNAIDGITPVDLKYDKWYVNDHLVEMEMATYQGDVTQIISTGMMSNAVVAEDSDCGTGSLKSRYEDDAVRKSEQDMPEKCLKFKNPYMNFKCKIVLINDRKIFTLSRIVAEDIAMMYEKMFTQIQSGSENLPPLNGIIENKACIALFEDKLWYRATILEFKEAQNEIKVLYVDYGIVGEISLADAREIVEPYVNVPPLSVSAKWHGIEVHPNLDLDFLLKEFDDIFADKGPFTAKVIENDEPFPTVELRDFENKLVCEKLIENGIFIKCDNGH